MDALGRRVGPFTIGVWLALVAAGVGAGLLLRRAGVFSDQTLDDPGAPAGAIGSGPTIGVPYGTGGFVIGQPSRAPAGDDTPIAAADTNLKWLNRAVAWAISTAKLQGSLVDTALRKYQEGRPLDQDERRVIDLILSEFGPPPEGVPSIENVPVPPPPPPTWGQVGDQYAVGSTGGRRHQVQEGDTGKSLMIRYHGGVDALTWARLKEANPVLRSLAGGNQAHLTRIPTTLPGGAPVVLNML